MNNNKKLKFLLRAKIRKWGTSLVIIIPSSVKNDFDLKEGDELLIFRNGE